jgi:VIT1/CCC1 family predicted Fe2+/Mn2+ transporter
MAAGEYVSVSSQTDTEQADIEREKQELKEMPEAELTIFGESGTASLCDRVEMPKARG